jgi:hypothetical protein
MEQIDYYRANDQDRTGDLILTMDVLYRLSYIGIRARDEARTRDPQLGRLMLYQLSYSRLCFLLPATPA